MSVFLWVSALPKSKQTGKSQQHDDGALGLDATAVVQILLK